MKLILIIIFICAAQTSASFFEEFRGAMYSVQDSFGRLMSDVYTDVSQTIGCTLLAVKQVLALDKGFHESSDYNRRCIGLVPSTSPEVPRIDKNNVAYSYINNMNANHELENMEKEFKTETDRLMAISALLKREVDNIPNDLKIQFQFEPEPREPVDSIWRNLKILHDVEHNNKNSARASEIHNVLDAALNIMNIKNTDSNKSDDDKIKIIVKDLEKGTKADLTEADDEFAKWKEELIEKEEIEVMVNNNKTHDLPSLIKDRDKNSTNINKSGSIIEERTASTAKPISTTTLSPEEAFQNYILAQLGPKDSISRKAAVDEATKLIKDSKHREKVFESLAKAESESSLNLFENTQYFNFGP